jgi:hypothetical protein
MYTFDMYQPSILSLLDRGVVEEMRFVFFIILEGPSILAS